MGGKVMDEPEGRELDALVAECVLGWQWYTWEGLKVSVLFPPGPAGEFWRGSWWIEGKSGEPDIESSRFYNSSKTPPTTMPIVPHFSAGTPAGREAIWAVIDTMTKEYHWRFQSPFTEGAPWFAGLTPLGVTGWNGRPDYEASGATLQEAVCRAALLCRKYAPGLPPLAPAAAPPESNREETGEGG